jgi:mRNA-degrading endonuclease RelE of RelBE toxin-antitoxin system
MAKELVFTKTFKENYKRLSQNLQERFDDKLTLFLRDPKHPSLNIHRYHGREDVWEGYINQKYRFTFSVTEDNIIFRNIGPHSIIDKGKV